MAKITPRVFISSTKEDLEPYRSAAKEAAIQAGFDPPMMEYFTAQSALPPYPACMAKVDPCDVLVVIVAHRYGWVPTDQPGEKDKSITWLECEHALQKNMPAEVLAFVVDEKCHWALELRESYRSMKAIEEGTDTPELVAEVKRNIGKLREFKQWLGSLGFRPSFCEPNDLKAKILAALYEWRDRHPEFRTAAGTAVKCDPTKYIQWLREQTAWIDIRGLQVGGGKAHRFPIRDLFVSLTTLLQRVVTVAEPVHSDGEPHTKRYDMSGNEIKEAPPRNVIESVDLYEALSKKRLMIVGDPGSGKTTFIRCVANLLCLDLLGCSTGGQHLVGLEQPLMPIMLRLSELVEHILNSVGSKDAPTTTRSPEWVIHFLATKSREFSWGLDIDYFRQSLRAGRALIFLDGLDEAPRREERQLISQLISDVAKIYGECHFVATSRPQGYIDAVRLIDFDHVQIEPFDDRAIETFLTLWTSALNPTNQQAVQIHRDELLTALASRPEIRRLAQNPVMLTALAVVHWNEKRLPEQRSDLYESILVWLSRSREQRPGRAPADQCLALLKQVALAMQNHKKGRQVQISKGLAARSIANNFRNILEDDRLEYATRFLDEEEVDSGIIVSRGELLQFWHLTFQEYLAARAIAGLPEPKQANVLLSSPAKLFSPEWREVVLLASGVLHGQGVEKVDNMIGAILDNLSCEASLVDKASCIGLLGAILQDLSPLSYQIRDARYETHLQDIRQLFDYRSSEEVLSSVDLTTKLQAAEALSEGGYLRLGTADADDWVRLEQIADFNGIPVKEKSHWFEIARYPVTVGEYRKFLESGAFHSEQFWKAGRFDSRDIPLRWDSQVQHPNRPVVGIRWYEAVAYCGYVGGRLPTDGEWDRAVFGERRERSYPWGKAGRDATRLNSGSAVGFPTPVGIYPLGATPEGVYDLFGNVYEWLQDEEGSGRAVRGGDWTGEGGREDWQMASNRHENVGFRCVRDVL